MSLIELLKVIILGIVEGVTEWLPISSTGHMILVDEFMKLDVSGEFMDMFLVVIQLGAIMAVVVLYFKKLWPFCRPQTSGSAGKRGGGSRVSKTWGIFQMDKVILWVKILVACLPAMLIGLPFNDLIEEKFNNYVVVAIALVVYGVAFILIENYNKTRKAKITGMQDLDFKTAFLIGVFQVLSLIPGTSRSGSTIIGGILLGTSRTVAAEFTFYLAIPVMFGASLLKILKFGLAFSHAELLTLAVGMLTAFAVSILAIKFLVGYIKKHDFKAFGWYRIVLGLLVLGYFAGKMLL